MNVTTDVSMIKIEDQYGIVYIRKLMDGSGSLIVRMEDGILLAEDSPIGYPGSVIIHRIPDTETVCDN